MGFISKGRSIAVGKEASYAVTPAVIVDADYIDYTQADIATSIEKIDRTVTRNSLLKLEAILGQESSSGTIAVEISAAAAGAINGDKLYENGIGKKIPQATATTATAGTTSTVTVTSAAGLAVGQVIRVNLDASTTEYVQIVSIASLVVTVVPNFSSAPTSGDAVQGLLTYILPKPSDLVTSLAIRENLKPQSGTPIDYDYLGVMVGETTLDYPVGNIATASFSLAGAGFDIDSTGTSPTLPCAIATPVVGKNATVKVGATSYVAKDLSVKVTTEATDVNAITSDGISNKVVVGKMVSGSFRIEYTGTTMIDTYQAGTKATMSLLLKDGGKTSPVIHGVIAPQIKFTNVTRSDDGGLLYDTVEFEVISPDCGTVERGLSVFFA